MERGLGLGIKVDSVAHATLGMGKSGDGLQAVEFWKKGDIDNLRKYCLQDVRITRDIYEYALAQQNVSFIDRLGQKQLIPLPIVPPQQDQKTEINLSLGL